MISKTAKIVKKYQNEITLFIGVILISLLSFSVGYLTAKNEDKTPIKFENINR